jgi:hypothetical protein
MTIKENCTLSKQPRRRPYVKYICVTCGGELQTCDNYGYCRKCKDYAYDEDGYAYPFVE